MLNHMERAEQATIIARKKVNYTDGRKTNSITTLNWG